MHATQRNAEYYSAVRETWNLVCVVVIGSIHMFLPVTWIQDTRPWRIASQGINIWHTTLDISLSLLLTLISIIILLPFSSFSN